ncbi:unnamed protein product [Cuscuta epithymum]|uniref:DUF6598 domain-containing protein n=1 Tax=Cuscuta epithymum TaxID=186058 RepID=A0AAV0EKK3_9ASTE|nr:unnamed protein product [Cuscuta epithymum]
MAGDQDISFYFDLYEDDYQEFISKVREALKYSTSHNIPMLMPQTQPLSWLDLHLTSGEATIILRMDRRNLYLRGYSRDGGQTFWEFSDSSLIPGSRHLTYSGSYASRTDSGSTLVGVAGTTRRKIYLGQQNLVDDIRNLARTEDPTTGGDDVSRCAKALLRLIQMFPESIRFQSITRHIATNWDSSAQLSEELVLLQNGWGTLSSAVQRADEPCWTPATPLPNIPSTNNPINIWTVGQAAVALGIMLYKGRHVNLMLLANEQLATVPETVGGASYFRTFLTVNYVRVLNIDGENPGDLYGTVKVTDFWGEHTVYDRASGDTEEVYPQGLITLTGPSTPIDADDSVTISVSLKDHDTLSPDDEIAEGVIVWEPRNENLTFANYGKLLEKVVKGQYGSVAVGYSVTRFAMNATVSVVLIDGDGESPADVYGTIKATSVPADDGSPSLITLFEKSAGDCIKVNPQEEIPLTRSAVVVPMDDGVTISAYLYDHDSVSAVEIFK